jgi:hypothetical protein
MCGDGVLCTSSAGAASYEAPGSTSASRQLPPFSSSRPGRVAEGSLARGTTGTVQIWAREGKSAIASSAEVMCEGI